jgi:hypothetical protein
MTCIAIRRVTPKCAPSVVSLLPLSHNDVASAWRSTSQELDMIRIIAKLFAVTIILTAFFNVGPPLAAAPLTFVASRGVDTNPCSTTLPCATIGQALAITAPGGQITCLDPTGSPLGLTDISVVSSSVTIDCSGTIVPSVDFGLSFTVPNQVFKIRNLTFDGTSSSGGPAIW